MIFVFKRVLLTVLNKIRCWISPHRILYLNQVRLILFKMSILLIICVCARVINIHNYFIWLVRVLNWNIAAEATSLVILGIIWTYSRKGSNLPSLKNRVFQGCLIVTFGAIFTNILSTIMIYNYCAIPIWMTWTVTMIYFILTPLMGMA